MTVPLDLSPLVGTWKNTNRASRGVVRLDIAAEGDALRIGAQAAEPWAATTAHVYSTDGFEVRAALAFNCTFDLGVMDVRLQANIKAGVLVIVFLTRFNDTRSNVFSREFYYRSAQ